MGPREQPVDMAGVVMMVVLRTRGQMGRMGNVTMPIQ